MEGSQITRARISVRSIKTTLGAWEVSYSEAWTGMTPDITCWTYAEN